MNDLVLDKSGRPLYKIWAEKYELLDRFILKSSLPEELMWYIGRDLLSHERLLRNFNIAQETRLAMVNRLHKSAVARYFYLPEEVLTYNNLDIDKFETYSSIINGEISCSDRIFSDFYNPLEFRALSYKFYKAQFLSYNEFEQEIHLINRREFESCIQDDRMVAEYVKNYCNYNLFYHVIEGDTNIYIMATGFDIELLIVDFPERSY